VSPVDRDQGQCRDPCQDAVFAFLSDPATHHGLAVQRIDTHAAVVFLVGERALKVKRAVRFPFLDFSTLAKRKQACHAEIEANRPFAPDLYRGIVAITREADATLALAGRGEPIEWAVEMRRFDETKTLDRLADKAGIDLALADALARAIAMAHAKAPVVDAVPWITALGAYVEQNDAAFRSHGELFPGAQVERLTCACRAALTQVRPLLIARGQQGLVRRGHGDLHLGNIALIGGRPVPFDALEFDPLIASGDVLYDLAFLLMDLVERKLPAQSNIVLNRYLAETGRHVKLDASRKHPTCDDLDALAALPLFLSVRAAIRAMATAARLPYASDADQMSVAQTARTYFQLATTLIAPPSPCLVAIGGLSGTGKSVLAHALAPDLLPAPGAVVLRSDVERKALFGLAESERLDPQAYRADVTARVYARLAEKACRVAAAGHSVIIDAVFAQPQERAAIAAAASGIHVKFRGLFLTANLETRMARVGARRHDASDADPSIARQQESYALGDVDWADVDASGTPEETLARARNDWR
jgi:aminoglycoside phosphotransferase family enzyme/predicted kinase